MKSLNQLGIPKRSMHCLHKGEQFVPGMEIYSLLREDGGHHFGRNDYCAACWQEIQHVVCLNPVSRGYWKSKMEPRNFTKESTRTTRALKLLKELLENAEREADEIFVLCLYLSHARQLALRQEFKQDGIAYQLYEILRHEEFITIPAVNHSHLQIEAIQKSLAQKLSTSYEA